MPPPRPRRPAAAGALLALLLAAPAALAAPPGITVPVCLDDALLVRDLVARHPVPVGCELVDCCPGCPGPGPLDWRVRVEGEAVEHLTLAFEGLAPDRAPRLEGPAERTGERTGVRVRPGETWLRGLDPGRGPRPPVASLGLVLRRDRLAALRRAEPGADGSVDTISVAVEQWLGPVRVNELHLAYPLERCAVPEPCDAVVLEGNRGGDRSVVLWDGRRADACLDDRVQRGAGSVPVGNVQAPGPCRSEVHVLSGGDALHSLAPATAWTDACGDRVVAQLAPALEAPVTLWLAKAGTGDLALADLENANHLFDLNKTGIGFAGTVKDVSGDLPAKVLIGLSCVAAEALPGSDFFVEGQLNVYYVPSPVAEFMTGANCDGVRNAIYVGSLANVATLAHELGHALSLFGDASTGGHTNGLGGFDEENVMWGGGPPTRQRFSLGQAFRLNLHPASAVNVNGVRSGPVRTCAPLASSSACPPLKLDWVRP